MKKQIYGIYVMLFGLWIKYFKKNDTKAQMKFLAAATKWSSMVLIVSFIIACAVPGGNPLAPGGGVPPKEKEVELKYGLGDWKAGLGATSEEIDSSGNKKNSTVGTIILGQGDSSEDKSSKSGGENLLIPNGDFEEPGVSCATMSCANRTTTEAGYGTKQSNLFNDWTITSGVAGIWRTNLKKSKEEQNQYLDLTGVIEQEIETRDNTRYLLTFLGGANTSCKEKEKTVTLKISWNGIQAASLNVKSKDMATYEVPVESSEGPSNLKLEGISKNSCGPTLDDLQLKFLETIPESEIVKKIEATVEPTIEPPIESIPQVIDGTVVPNPEVTPVLEDGTIVPTATPTTEGTPDPEISTMPTPTPTPAPDTTPTPIPTATPIPTITPIPSPTPTPTPIHTPTAVPPTPSKYDIPGQATAITEGNIISFSKPPKLDGDIISFKGKVLTKKEPLVVQVWNTQGTEEARKSDAKYDANVCSTEQPSIFYRKPPELGYAYLENSVLIAWTYCLNTYDVSSENTVPWESPDKWVWNKSNGEFTFEGNKLGGAYNQYETVGRYIVVVIGPQGVMTRRKVN